MVYSSCLLFLFLLVFAGGKNMVMCCMEVWMDVWMDRLAVGRTEGGWCIDIGLRVVPVLSHTEPNHC